MLWFLSTEQKQKPPSRWRDAPRYTLGMIGLSLFLSGWVWLTQSSNQSQQDQAMEQVQCFYLRHEHVSVPLALLQDFPPLLQRHVSKSVTPLLREYQVDPAAQPQAERWRKEGNWRQKLQKAKLKRPYPQSLPTPPGIPGCLGQALTKEQLSRNSKRRIFIQLAGLQPQKQKRDEEQFQTLTQRYFEAKAAAPLHRLGLRHKQVGFATFTSLLLYSSPLVWCWTMLLLLLVSTQMERYWGGPLWLLFLLGGGLLGNIALAFLLPRLGTPILGTGTLLAMAIGLWFAEHGLRFQRLAFALPGQGETNTLFAFPGVAIPGLWFICSVASQWWSGIPSYTIGVVALCFALGVVFFAALQPSVLVQEWRPIHIETVLNWVQIQQERHAAEKARQAAEAEAAALAAAQAQAAAEAAAAEAAQAQVPVGPQLKKSSPPASDTATAGSILPASLLGPPEEGGILNPASGAVADSILNPAPVQEGGVLAPMTASPAEPPPPTTQGTFVLGSAGLVANQAGAAPTVARAAQPTQTAAPPAQTQATASSDATFAGPQPDWSVEINVTATPPQSTIHTDDWDDDWNNALPSPAQRDPTQTFATDDWDNEPSLDMLSLPHASTDAQIAASSTSQPPAAAVPPRPQNPAYVPTPLLLEDEYTEADEAEEMDALLQALVEIPEEKFDQFPQQRDPRQRPDQAPLLRTPGKKR